MQKERELSLSNEPDSPFIWIGINQDQLQWSFADIKQA